MIASRPHLPGFLLICGLLLSGCGSAPANSPMAQIIDPPGSGPGPTPPISQCSSSTCVFAVANLSLLAAQAAVPTSASLEVTNSPIHRDSNVFPAYRSNIFGTGQIIGIVSTALAGYAQDLRRLQVPINLIGGLPADNDDKIARTFGSPALSGLSQYGIPSEDFVFNHDALFNFQLDLVDGEFEDDNKVREMELAGEDSFQDYLRRDFGILVTGPVGLILEDYRTVGTAAASIAAGSWHNQDDDHAVLGVAPDATLYNYPAENFFSQYCRALNLGNPQTDCGTTQAQKFRRILYARSIGLAATGKGHGDTVLPASDIIYTSYIGSQTSADFSDDPMEILNEYADFHTALTAAKTAQKFVVLAAGDDSGANPTLPATLPQFDPNLVSHVLVVIATGSNGAILPTSNRCGTAEDFCIAVPGEDLLATWLNPGGSHTDTAYDLPYYGTYATDPLTDANTDRVSGTRYAAAAAAGAIALVSSHFDSLSPEDVLIRIKALANREGLYDDSFIYGRGLLDVGNAIDPAGETSLPLTTEAAGPQVLLSASALQLLSPTFGDALDIGLAGHYFIALDGLNSPFSYEAKSLLQHKVQHPVHGKPLVRSAYLLGEASQLHLYRHAEDASSAALSWHVPGLQLQLSHRLSPGLMSGLAAQRLAGLSPLQSDSALFAPWAMPGYHWRSAGATALPAKSIRLSWTHFSGENAASLASSSATAGLTPARQSGSLLAVSTTGRLHQAGVQWVSGEGVGEVLGLSGGAGIGQVHLQATNLWGTYIASKGTTLLGSLWQLNARADRGAGLLSGTSDLQADAWILGYAGHRWMLRLEQPLRMRAGELLLRLPTAHRANRSIVFDTLAVSALPSGREIRLQADLTAPVHNGRLQFSLGMAREPGHLRRAEPDPYALLSLSLPLR